MSEAKKDDSDLSALLCAGFQPIETAPKDGTEVIVRFVYGEGEAVEIKNAWFNSGWRRICHNSNSYQYFSFGKVTHWLPIPKLTSDT